MAANNNRRLHREAIARHAKGIWAQVKAWVGERWSEIKQVAAKLWRGVCSAATFIVDVGALCWAILFADAEEFELLKERFKAKYLTTRLNEKVLARELAKAMAQ